MNNETLKRDLCARLMDGVKVSYKRHKNEPKRKIATLTGYTRSDGYETTHRKYNGCVGDLIKEEGNNNIYDLDFKPILFSTSALTKPIQIANYNNGEPFVPIYELAKLFHTLSTDNIEAYTDAVEHGFYGAQCTCWISVKEGRCNYFQMPFGEFITSAEHRIIKMLYQWHINIELSPEQFIEVTNEFNPYK